MTLLIKTLPLVAAETAFALKGGTAINLFVRDMPRLSVDIDLTYVPVAIASPPSRKSMRRSAGSEKQSSAAFPVHL